MVRGTKRAARTTAMRTGKKRTRREVTARGQSDEDAHAAHDDDVPCEDAQQVSLAVTATSDAEESMSDPGLDFDDVHSDAAVSAEEEEDLDGDIADEDDFELKAAKYRRRMLVQRQLAAEEQQDEARQRESHATPLGDLEQERSQLLGQTHSAEELRDRVQETLRVLSHFRQEREEDRTRAEYVDLLRSDLMVLYEYNDFLMDAILLLFPPAEAVDFLEAMDKPRPTTIRVNTLKSKRRDLVQALTKRDMNVEPLEKWSKVGLQVFESNVPIAGTVEYLAGYYMLQAAASFLPVMALAPQEHERVLDMSAAPGGKTTYIAQLMKNTGVLFANDVSEQRCKSLNANLQRLGVSNCIVTNYDGRHYEKVMRNFDRVLLDAPCTGTGIISRDKSIKSSKHYEDVQRASQLQRELLLSAIDACKVGGCVVYSTCSFLVEEDEAIVDFALHRRAVQVVEMGLPFGRPGLTKYRHHRYDDSLALSRRYFPHVHNMDGFFVCKLRKLADDGGRESGDRNTATSTSATTDTVTTALPSTTRTSRQTPGGRQVAHRSVNSSRAASSAEASVSSIPARVSVPPPTAVRDDKAQDKKATTVPASRRPRRKKA